MTPLIKVMTVVGTRPELIRLSLVFERFAQSEIDHVLVHTGQNYEPCLSDVFFDELALPRPDIYMAARADRVGEQIGQIISAADQAMLEHRPNARLILGTRTAVVGDRRGTPEHPDLPYGGRQPLL